jgi:hypothetical protein
MVGTPPYLGRTKAVLKQSADGLRLRCKTWLPENNSHKLSLTLKPLPSRG